VKQNYYLILIGICQFHYSIAQLDASKYQYYGPKDEVHIGVIINTFLKLFKKSRFKTTQSNGRVAEYASILQGISKLFSLFGVCSKVCSQ
jgi:hypothetical protein